MENVTQIINDFGENIVQVDADDEIKDFFKVCLSSIIRSVSNAVDYPRTHQLEMYWLGFAQDSLTALKKQNVGTESVSASYYKNRHEIGVPEADKVMAEIFEVIRDAPTSPLNILRICEKI